MENKIVAHMKDGTIHKGVTHDFAMDRPQFHVLPAEGGGVPVPVQTDDMKALFYVKDYFGNRDFNARRAFSDAVASGKRAVITFKDGEEIWGYLGEGSEEDSGLGFFFSPADKDDNNIRIFVIRSALDKLERKD